MTTDECFAAAGAAAWGCCAYADLLPYMDEHARARAQELCSDPAGVFVAAFPYYAGDHPGNLSLYARGEDYHTAVTRRLTMACAHLSRAHPGRIFQPGADNSPLPERAAAWQAGLGHNGLNGMTLLPQWGSYLFLGTVLTDLPLEGPEAPAPDCIRCGRCAAACPGGAIGDHGIDPERCLSHFTQTKGALTPAQEALLRHHPLAWGCDICQQVCPYNQGAPLSPLPEFREGLVYSLTREDVAGLTNRQFKEKFPGRAFTWRGPRVILRNLDLQGG